MAFDEHESPDGSIAYATGREEMRRPGVERRPLGPDPRSFR